MLSTMVRPAEPQGNLLLDLLLGASVEFVSEPLGKQLWDRIRAAADRFEKAGHKVFSIVDPIMLPTAAVGYIEAAIEFEGQSASAGLNPAAIYVASGGPTGAGLMAARQLMALPWQLQDVLPIRLPFCPAEHLANLANRACELADLPTVIEPIDVVVRDEFVGPGFGIPSNEGTEAMKLVARTEGIVLDPIYTAKAMAAMLNDIKQGKWGPDDAVVLWHTGGVPAIFAWSSELAAEFSGPLAAHFVD